MKLNVNENSSTHQISIKDTFKKDYTINKPQTHY